jgi:hypothetical protein
MYRKILFVSLVLCALLFFDMLEECFAGALAEAAGGKNSFPTITYQLLRP